MGVNQTASRPVQSNTSSAATSQVAYGPVLPSKSRATSAWAAVAQLKELYSGFASGGLSRTDISKGLKSLLEVKNNGEYKFWPDDAKKNIESILGQIRGAVVKQEQGGSASVEKLQKAYVAAVAGRTQGQAVDPVKVLNDQLYATKAAFDRNGSNWLPSDRERFLALESQIKELRAAYPPAVRESASRVAVVDNQPYAGVYQNGTLTQGLIYREQKFRDGAWHTTGFVVEGPHIKTSSGDYSARYKRYAVKDESGQPIVEGKEYKDSSGKAISAFEKAKERVREMIQYGGLTTQSEADRVHSNKVVADSRQVTQRLAAEQTQRAIGGQPPEKVVAAPTGISAALKDYYKFTAAVEQGEIHGFPGAAGGLLPVPREQMTLEQKMVDEIPGHRLGASIRSISSFVPLVSPIMEANSRVDLFIHPSKEAIYGRTSGEAGNSALQSLSWSLILGQFGKNVAASGVLNKALPKTLPELNQFAGAAFGAKKLLPTTLREMGDVVKTGAVNAFKFAKKTVPPVITTTSGLGAGAFLGNNAPEFRNKKSEANTLTPEQSFRAIQRDPSFVERNYWGNKDLVQGHLRVIKDETKGDYFFRRVPGDIYEGLSASAKTGNLGNSFLFKPAEQALYVSEVLNGKKQLVEVLPPFRYPTQWAKRIYQQQKDPLSPFGITDKMTLALGGPPEGVHMRAVWSKNLGLLYRPTETLFHAGVNPAQLKSVISWDFVQQNTSIVESTTFSVTPLAIRSADAKNLSVPDAGLGVDVGRLSLYQVAGFRNRSLVKLPKGEPANAILFKNAGLFETGAMYNFFTIGGSHNDGSPWLASLRAYAEYQVFAGDFKVQTNGGNSFQLINNSGLDIAAEFQTQNLVPSPIRLFTDDLNGRKRAP